MTAASPAPGGVASLDPVPSALLIVEFGSS
jgi:hypothetical protein